MGGIDEKSKGMRNMPRKYTVAYPCSDSTETRGKRKYHTWTDKKTEEVRETALKAGCGHWNTRGMDIPIEDNEGVQGTPCKNCNRRQRLNRGMTHEVRHGRAFTMDGDRRIYHFMERRELTPAERQGWARDYAKARNDHRLGLCSNLSERIKEINEYWGV